MSKSKSPFVIVEDFISPLMCEEIVDELNFITPDTNTDGEPLPSHKTHDRFERMVFDRIQTLVPQLEEYFDFEYKGTERVDFQWVPEGAMIQPHCDSSEFLNGRWLKTKQRDFTCVLFFTDFNNKPPFDDDFECCGGKLEFPNHQFGFNPQRGTLIVFPSDARFVNASATAVVGELHQAKIHIAATSPYIYDPKAFPGNYTTWFS